MWFVFWAPSIQNPGYAYGQQPNKNQSMQFYGIHKKEFQF